MKSLILLRHAKAAPAAAGGDHHRPLDERGRQASALVGAHLRSLGLRPDILLVSSALRTRETCQIVAAAAGLPEPQFEDDLYLASSGVLLRRIRKTPPRAGSLMVIGHNPGLAELMVKLSDPAESDAEALARARTRVPTCSCAVLNVLTPWSEIQDGDCGMTAFITPKLLGGTDEE